jgi:nucleotide-binding universal stress UspA family protein
MYKKILLPTDNSEPSERAGEYAIASADLEGADVIVLYVIDTHYLDSLPQQDLREELEKELLTEGKETVEKFEKKIEEKQCAGQCKNINLITMIKKGRPTDVILKTADELGVDQIVMGKSGKHGIEKFILGNTSERVLRKAKVPVNIII